MSRGSLQLAAESRLQLCLDSVLSAHNVYLLLLLLLLGRANWIFGCSPKLLHGLLAHDWAGECPMSVRSCITWKRSQQEDTGIRSRPCAQRHSSGSSTSRPLQPEPGTDPTVQQSQPLDLAHSMAKAHLLGAAQLLLVKGGSLFRKGFSSSLLP